MAGETSRALAEWKDDVSLQSADSGDVDNYRQTCDKTLTFNNGN
jgi:hypothetical protein